VRAGIGRRSGDLASLWQNPQLRARHEQCRAAQIEFQERRRIDAFWARVDKSGGDDKCWPWLTSIGDQGYGVYQFRDERLAHRIAFILAKGPLEPGVKVLHAEGCPRRCVNPAHLRAGTQAENMEDKRRAGRARGGPRFGRGELNNRARYCRTQVVVAWEMRGEGYTLADISTVTAITRRSLENIFRGATWAFSTLEMPL
jgi:hypothetical protein